MEKKPRREIQDPPDDGEAWLISYADMMTLVACFFILMMAFANYDPAGFTKKVEEVSKHFNKDKFKSSDTKLTTLTEEVAKHPELKKMTKISMQDTALAVTISSSVIFSSGSFTLTEESTALLDTLIDIIKTKDPNYRILVEGHTDNQARAEGTEFTSKWALSGARAASVVERFEYHGFDPSTLVAIGLGDTKPLLPNEDDKGFPIPQNQKVNRRVVIKILEPIDGTKLMKLGLGVYFKDGTEAPVSEGQ